MPAGQTSGTGGMTDLDDEKVEKNKILTNRDKSQHEDSFGYDGKGTQAETDQDTPANRRS